jgi:hypothetical protein
LDLLEVGLQVREPVHRLPDLVNLQLLVLLHHRRHRLGARLHRLHDLDRVLHALHRESGAVDVGLLLVELVALRLVEPPLLEDDERAALGGLERGAGAERAQARAVLQQLLVQLPDLLVQATG